MPPTPPSVPVPSDPQTPGRSGPPPAPAPVPAGLASAPVNLILIVGSVLVAVATSLGDNTARLLPLFISLEPANSPNWLIEVRHGEVWRLLTPAFIHFSIQHIGFNLLGLKNVGDLMERVHGSRFYLFLTAVLALCSNLGQYFINGSPAFGGMSGVLYGLFGFLWTRGVFDPAYPLKMTRQTVVISLVWFVACFTGVLGPIANGAHTTGLILGAVWGLAAGRAAAKRLIGGPSDPGAGPVAYHG